MLSKQDIIYLSGQMSNLEDHGFGLFEKASKEIRDKGFKVVSPHELDGGDTSNSWENYLKRDLKVMMDCTAVVVLPNWRNSRGAKLEVQVAQEVEIPIYTYPDLEPLRELNILEEAIGLVTGDRNKQYGHPYADYKCSSDMFNAWMTHKHPNGYRQIDPYEAVVFMTFVKMSRLANSYKRDSAVDASGYLLCGDMIKNKMNEETEVTLKSFDTLLNSTKQLVDQVAKEAKTSLIPRRTPQSKD